MILTTRKNLAFAAVLCLTAAACSDDGASVADPGDDTVNVEAANLGSENIVNTAVAAGTFNTLAAALQATGLDSVLADDSRNFTVFAPTDDAFAELGQDTINALLNDTETLSDILLYHVVPDTVVNAATALSLDGQSVTAANGDDFALNVDNGDLFVNMSKVTATDIGASNGIIHVIDKVLLPPADMPTEEQPASNIVDTAVAAGSFSTLVAALQATGLDATLAGEGPFTVFAPTDEAFKKLGQDTINNLLADPDTLSNILLYHVIAGQAVNAATAISLDGSSVAMANNDSVQVTLSDGNLFINDSQVTSTDIMTSNGIIHVIDTVLLPPAMQQPEEPVQPEVPAASGTILDVAESAGFTTLVAAVKAAGLDGALDHPGDLYTVFAPTDDAFAALGSDTINALLADPDTLRDILLFHVIPGTVVDAATAVGLVGVDIHAGNGGLLQLEQRDDGLYINGAKITVTDVQAVNGIIHVIDAVLIPPAH